MQQSYDKSAAIVVLPRLRGHLRDMALKKWLSRADLGEVASRRSLLPEILECLGRTSPETGLAAMRMWGQTGDRPTVWIAAADPVYLEPRLDHLCLHTLREPEVSKAELKALFDHLQEVLSPDSGYGFARLGHHGYLRSEQAIATAGFDAEVVDGLVPNDFLPGGEDAATFRGLLSEVEMALHEHPVNVEREMRGKAPVNSLWIWGGGFAPGIRDLSHPPLFADDPMLRGYWASVSGEVETWPGTIAACLQESSAGFVAVLPNDEDDRDSYERCLRELRDALLRRRISRLTLLFADGVRATVRASHRLRFWRPLSRLLEPTAV